MTDDGTKSHWIDDTQIGQTLRGRFDSNTIPEEKSSTLCNSKSSFRRDSLTYMRIKPTVRRKRWGGLTFGSLTFVSLAFGNPTLGSFLYDLQLDYYTGIEPQSGVIGENGNTTVSPGISSPERRGSRGYSILFTEATCTLYLLNQLSRRHLPRPPAGPASPPAPHQTLFPTQPRPWPPPA